MMGRREAGVESRLGRFNAGWSNGRTCGFGPHSLGSSPRPAALI